MVIRLGEDSKEFRKKLQNVPNPINDIRTSPEMEDYLYRLNSGEIAAKDQKERDEKATQEAERNSQYKLFCPKCRKTGTLKLTNMPHTWACGFCGLVTNSPLRMAETKQVREKR